MNPVTRYVKEVERSLSGPSLLKGGRLKTSAMIYKDLSNRVDALEAKLGREPTDAEMAALLGEFGAPAEVAARYSGMATQAPSHDLLERYLAAVERRLPKEQGSDIAAELREAIEARIVAKSAELGREAGADEVAAILKEYGHPTLAAARYQSQQYLIGPGLYPWFWPAQRTALGIALAVLVVLTVVDVLDSMRPMAAFITKILGWWEPLAMVFGVVTLVFMVMERSEAPVQLAQRWDPKTLPRDHVRPPKPLFETLFALAFDAVFILWWMGAISFQQVFAGRSPSIIVEPTSAWDQVYMPVLALAIVTAAVHVADLVYPAWSRARSAASILGHAGGLAVIWVLLQSGPLLETSLAPGVREQLGGLLPLPEMALTVGLWIAAVAWAIGLGWEVWRQVRATKPVRPVQPPPAGVHAR
jgi:hypothetical protein